MKVNVKNQKSEKKYQHDLSHDVSTSMNFGHLQPLMCRELSAKSTAQLRAAQLVRLMPMVTPTFGRMTLNTYNTFVPIESIFHPYESMRGQQSYFGSEGSYIPSQVINAPSFFLDYVAKQFSKIVIFSVTDPLVTSASFKAAKQDMTPIYSDSNNWSNFYNDYINKLRLDSYLNYDACTNFCDRLAAYTYEYSNGDLDDPYAMNQYDWFYYCEGEQTQSNILVCGKYTRLGDSFRKVCYGLGYKFLSNDTPLTMLPLFAYYKAYFDLFNPQRNITWKDTSAFAVTEWMEQHGNFRFLDTTFLSERYLELVDFFVQLSMCYYTQSVDYVSAHITGQSISNIPELSFSMLNADNASVDVMKDVSNAQAYIAADGISSVSQSNLDVLKAMYHRINRKTVYGGKIKEFLLAELGSDALGLDESYWIGSQKVDINISPVFNQAETSVGYLGEFAGQAVGSDQGTVYKYTADVDGYWVCMATIVPDTRMAQGIDPNLKHVNLIDFFDPIYDSLTLLPNEQMYIYGEQDFRQEQSVTEYARSFGNIPNYMEYCVAQNVLNGDMSKPSTRASFLPFTLDKLLPYTEITEDEDQDEITIGNLPQTVLVNGETWRYIGKDAWLGNFNRIFRNSGSDSANYRANGFGMMPIGDNFAVHNYLDFKVWSFKLPVRDSFQTGVFDKDSLTMDKA